MGKPVGSSGGRALPKGGEVAGSNPARRCLSHLTNVYTTASIPARYINALGEQGNCI